MGGEALGDGGRTGRDRVGQLGRGRVVDEAHGVGRADHVDVEVGGDAVELGGGERLDVGGRAEQALLLGGPQTEAQGGLGLDVGGAHGLGDLEQGGDARAVVVDARPAGHRVEVGAEDHHVVGRARQLGHHVGHVEGRRLPTGVDLDRGGAAGGQRLELEAGVTRQRQHGQVVARRQAAEVDLLGWHPDAALGHEEHPGGPEDAGEQGGEAGVAPAQRDEHDRHRRQGVEVVGFAPVADGEHVAADDRPGRGQRLDVVGPLHVGAGRRRRALEAGRADLDADVERHRRGLDVVAGGLELLGDVGDRGVEAGGAHGPVAAVGVGDGGQGLEVLEGAGLGHHHGGIGGVDRASGHQRADHDQDHHHRRPAAPGALRSSVVVCCRCGHGVLRRRTVAPSHRRTGDVGPSLEATTAPGTAPTWAATVPVPAREEPVDAPEPRRPVR